MTASRAAICAVLLRAKGIAMVETQGVFTSIGRFAIAAVFGVLFGAPAQAASEQKMQDCSGLPCMSLEVGDGIKLKVLIDTGNAHSLLDLSTAKKLGLELTQAKHPDGAPIPGYFFATLKNVRFGTEMLGDLRVLVVDLNADIAKGTFAKADGTIAYVDLKDKVLTLDYRRHVVGLAVAPATSACTGPCGVMSNPTFGKKGPPIVVTTGFQVNGKDLAMQVDTAYSGTMLIFPTSVAKLGLDTEAASKKVEHFPFTDGGVDMIEGVARTESFGPKVILANAPLYFATPKVHLPDGMFDGTVGVAFFAGQVVHMDFRSQTFWME
jgi:hypothetical protein